MCSDLTLRHKSRCLLSNAVGKFGQQQLRWLSDKIDIIRGPLIVACHHHVGWVGSIRRDLADLTMVAMDGGQLLRMLVRYNKRTGAPVLVVHGHKHMLTYGQVSGSTVMVFGAPSTSLGTSITATSIPDGVPGFSSIYLSGDGKSWQVEYNRLQLQPSEVTDE